MNTGAQSAADFESRNQRRQLRSATSGRSSAIVAIDLFQLADTLGNTKTFVNAVDMASRFQIVAPCESKHPRVVFATFMGVWCCWAGLPKAVLSDRGGEFNKEFSEELEAMNVELLNSAAIPRRTPSASEPADLGSFMQVPCWTSSTSGSPLEIQHG